MQKLYFGLSFAFNLVSLALPAQAQRPSVTVGVNGGTLGAGGDVALGLNKMIAVRAGGHFASVKPSLDVEGITYNGALKWKNGQFLLDLHPMGNALRLSTGLFLNGNKINIAVDPASSVTLGGQTYAAAEIGTLSGAVTFQTAAPYFGLGFGSSGKIGFGVDLGVVLQGKPRVAYTGTTTLTGAAQQQFNQNVAAEMAQIQAKVDDFSLVRYYPVLSAGLMVKLF